MWEQRYSSDDYLFGKEPAAFLRAHQSYLIDGKSALVVADGPKAVENLYTHTFLCAAFSGWEILECHDHISEINEGKGHSGQSALIDFFARKPA